MSLSTVRGEFVLKSVEAVDMAALIETNLEGLRQRSVFALAQQDASKPGTGLQHVTQNVPCPCLRCTYFTSLPASADDPMFLVCKRGDLLLAEKDDKYSPEENWIKATNEQTGISGAVYKDTLQFLPTLSRPTDEMLVELLLLLLVSERKEMWHKNIFKFMLHTIFQF